MTGKLLTKKEMLYFKLNAYISSEKNKKAVAEHRKQRFEEKTGELYSYVCDFLADAPGIQVIVTEPFLQDTVANVGNLELDILGKKVEISPALRDAEMVLEVNGLIKGDLHFVLGDDSKWRAVKQPSYGWSAVDDDFWITHLSALVPTNQ